MLHICIVFRVYTVLPYLVKLIYIFQKATLYKKYFVSFDSPNKPVREVRYNLPLYSDVESGSGILSDEVPTVKSVELNT